jgi:hypothetical protein
LIVEGAVHQLRTTRDAQGQLLIRQLAEDAALGVSRQDTVSLALLANRYSQRPDVVSMRILAADGHVLTTGGNAPTHDGQTFQQILLQDRTQNGQVELTLAEISIGEVIRLQWLPLLLSFLIHIFLWLLYRVVARPKQRVGGYDEGSYVEGDHVDLQHATQLPLTEAPAVSKPAPVSLDPAAYPVVLRLAFDDRGALLDTLAPSTAHKYFALCQKILEETIRVLQASSPIDDGLSKVQILEPFGANGALVGINQSSTHAIGHLLLLGQLLNLISEAVYRRNKVEKRFALLTRAAISESNDSAPAAQQSEALLPHAKGNDVLIAASSANMSRLIIQFSLSALEQPVDNVGDVMRLSGLRSDQAQLIERAREQILGRSAS